MDKKLKIFIIIGSTRQNRFSEKPAKWLYEEAKKREDLEVELVDLRDFPLPFFNEPVSPSYMQGEYKDELARKWVAKIGEADGYIFVTPEYNHGYSAVLKNAIDYVYHQWNKKPVAFLSYGGVGGARAVEQLREVVVELQMVPMRSAIHIPGPVYMAAVSQKPDDTSNPFASLEDPKNAMFDNLTWWARVLKDARDK